MTGQLPLEPLPFPKPVPITVKAGETRNGRFTPVTTVAPLAFFLRWQLGGWPTLGGTSPSLPAHPLDCTHWSQKSMCLTLQFRPCVKMKPVDCPPGCVLSSREMGFEKVPG